MQHAAQHPPIPHEHKTFKHSHVNLGSIMRSTARMAAASWLIEKLQLSDPLHRTLAFAAAGVGIGYVESLLKQRRDEKEEGRPSTRERG